MGFLCLHLRNDTKRCKRQHWLNQPGDKHRWHGLLVLDPVRAILVTARVVISERGLKEGNVEYQHRRDTAATPVALSEMVAHLKGKL